MRLKLIRDIKNEKNTLGMLYIDDEFFCYTCEDKVRDYNNDGDFEDEGEGKIYGETAIPKGEYLIALTFSNRFQKILPEILNVRYFTGVRIHAGNTAKDSHGCVLVGMDRSEEGVWRSKMAMNKLMAKLNSEKVIILEIL